NCDLLMALGRNTEVPAHIEPNSTSEALQTRRLLAMKASRDKVMPFANQLRASGHRRELAMLQLDLINEPAAALENALCNWEQQKEPIDARLVLRAALACGKASAAEPVLQWLTTTKLEDRSIEALKRGVAVGDRPRSVGHCQQ